MEYADLDLTLAQLEDRLGAGVESMSATQAATSMRLTLTLKDGSTVSTTLSRAQGNSAGVMTYVELNKINALPAAGSIGNALSGCSLGAGTTSRTLTFTRWSGTSLAVTLPAATTSAAGLMASADKTALNASVKNVARLTVTGTGYFIQVTKNDGSTSNILIDMATQTYAGLMTAADKKKLDGLSGGGGAFQLKKSLLTTVETSSGQTSALADDPTALMDFIAGGGQVLLMPSVAQSGWTTHALIVYHMDTGKSTNRVTSASFVCIDDYIRDGKLRFGHLAILGNGNYNVTDCATYRLAE